MNTTQETLAALWAKEYVKAADHVFSYEHYEGPENPRPALDAALEAAVILKDRGMTDAEIMRAVALDAQFKRFDPTYKRTILLDLSEGLEAQSPLTKKNLAALVAAKRSTESVQTATDQGRYR
jgi:hypothetical protein